MPSAAAAAAPAPAPTSVPKATPGKNVVCDGTTCRIVKADDAEEKADVNDGMPDVNQELLKQVCSLIFCAVKSDYDVIFFIDALATVSCWTWVLVKCGRASRFS